MLDYGAQSKRHLTMILNDSMRRFGLTTTLTKAGYSDDFDHTDYYEGTVLYPDEKDPPEDSPVRNIKVLLSKPVEGLYMDANFISYADKTMTQYKVTSMVKLYEDDKLDIIFPDNKKLTLRITESLSYHPFSTVYFQSVGIVI